jgi:hypothetical protein
MKKAFKERQVKNLPQLDSLISEIEGGKSRVKIGDIREVRKIIVNLIKNNPSVREVLNKDLAKKNVHIDIEDESNLDGDL